MCTGVVTLSKNAPITIKGKKVTIEVRMGWASFHTPSNVYIDGIISGKLVSVKADRRHGIGKVVIECEETKKELEGLKTIPLVYVNAGADDKGPRLVLLIGITQERKDSIETLCNRSNVFPYEFA